MGRRNRGPPSGFLLGGVFPPCKNVAGGDSPSKAISSLEKLRLKETLKYMMEGLQSIYPTLTKVFSHDFSWKRNKLRVGERFIKYSKIFQGYCGWSWEFLKWLDAFWSVYLWSVIYHTVDFLWRKIRCLLTLLIRYRRNSEFDEWISECGQIMALYSPWDKNRGIRERLWDT